MDTIEMIQDAILNFCEDAKIIPCNNGGIQVNVEDPTNIPGVITTVADVMYDYSLDDIQITTNQARCEVYIDICDREEDDGEGEDPELWPEDELKMEERPVPIKKGDMIQYRVNFVTVLQVLKDGAWVEGPYGEVQMIDWDDIKQYNPEPDWGVDKEEEEVYDYTEGAEIEWNGKPAKISRTEYRGGSWCMILRDLETKEEIVVSLAEFNKIQPKNI